MRRPVDQAKLLFLYLLRSSAALATESKLGATTASASASAAEAASSFAAASAHSPPPLPPLPPPPPPAASPPFAGHIALRVARRSDVPHIQRCNLATLPENYSANFYAQHMRQWPELALVAEHIPPDANGIDINGSSSGAGRLGERRGVNGAWAAGVGGGSPAGASVRRRKHLRPFVTSYFGGGGEPLCDFDDYEDEEGLDDPPRIVGYVLGKVDRDVIARDYPADPFADPAADSVPNGGFAMGSARNRVAPLPSSGVDNDYDDYDDDMSFLWESLRGSRKPNSSSLRPHRRPRRENLGHVTSLAVMPDFRRQGLAAELMAQLHRHMRAPPYRADAVGLHVRVSNRAATKLYGGAEGTWKGKGGGTNSGQGSVGRGGSRERRSGMGYKVADVIRGYYQDGEDAYFMRKEFAEDDMAVSVPDTRQLGGTDGGSGRVRRALNRLRMAGGGSGEGSNGRAAMVTSPWGGESAVGPEDLRLPRYIPLTPDAEVVSEKKTVSARKTKTLKADCWPERPEEREEEEQVMSGAA